MTSLLFPLQFKRQYSGPLDADNVFTLTSDRVAYLSNPLRYAGQVVFDTQDTTLYYLNSALDTWINVGSNNLINYLPLSGGRLTGSVTSISSISAQGIIYAAGGNSSQWQSTYTTVQNNSATTWNYQGTDLKALSGNWQSTYTTVCANSASWIKSTSTLETPTTGISTISNIISLSQTTYNALTVKRPDTFYIII